MTFEMQERFSKAKFNIGLKLLEIIGDRIDLAMRKYQKGDIASWFYTMKGIKMLIIAKIPPKYVVMLKAQELKISKLLSRARTEPKRYRGLLGDEVEDYFSNIMTIADKIGISIPAREARHLIFGQKENEKSMVDPEEEFQEM